MLSAKDYIRKYTSVPSQFIEDYFSFIDENTDNSALVINIDFVAKWLKVKKFNIIRTLNRSYQKDIDFAITKSANPNRAKYGNNYKKVLITPDTFKNLCMMSRSENAQQVRDYFKEIENTFLKYRNEINNALSKDLKRLQNNQKPKPSKGGPGWIYGIRASDSLDNVFKLGRTNDLARRISQHSSSKMDDVEVIFQYKTEHMKEIESCAKAWLKEFQYRKYKEVYQVDETLLRKVITKCAAVGATKEYALRTKSKKTGGYYLVFSHETA